jgi:hypothetical protein
VTHARKATGRDRDDDVVGPFERRWSVVVETVRLMPDNPTTWRTNSAIGSSGSGFTSWSTSSDSASDGVFTMSTSSRTHW